MADVPVSRSGSAKLTDQDPSKFTSDDIPFVKSDFIFDYSVNYEQLQSPLRKVHDVNNFSTVEETNRWMEVKHAAKMLHIQVEEIPVLNAGKVELAWAKQYRIHRYSASKTAINSAAEVLLEYCDSAMHVTHTRDYYGKIVNKAREAMDSETRLEKAEIQGVFLKCIGGGLLMCGFGMCFMILFHYFRVRGEGDMPGLSAASAVMETVKFATRNNAEPPPDYSTRARLTPSQIDIDRADGYVPLELNRLHRDAEKDVANALATEDALTLQLLNEEMEHMRQEERESNSRVSSVDIILEKDATEMQKAAAAEAAAAAAAAEEASKVRGVGAVLSQVGDQFESFLERIPDMPSKMYARNGRLLTSHESEVQARIEQMNSRQEGRKPS